MKQKGWKKGLLQYLQFTKKERIAILFLLFTVLVIRLVPFYWKPVTAVPDPVPDSLVVALLKKTEPDSGAYYRADSWKQGKKISPFAKRFERKPTRGILFTMPDSAKLFRFDPNSVSKTDLQKLGVPERTIGTILKFREKGGRFRKADDLGKIYGMPAELTGLLVPYVELNRSGKETKRPQKIKINTADSLSWLELPGIGPALTGRILKYRERLGGFVSISQLSEIYGLQDSVFQQLKNYLELDSVAVRKISLNSSTLEELARHPYIRWKQAEAIIRYRNMHGAFTDINSLSAIHLLDTVQLVKMVPYCDFK